MTIQNWQYKLIFIIAVMLNEAQADRRVLGKVNIFGENVGRVETISLDNDKDLVIQGMYDVQYELPNDSLNILKSTVEYVADINGNRVKYTLIKEPQYPAISLSPSSLKTLAG